MKLTLWLANGENLRLDVDGVDDARRLVEEIRNGTHGHGAVWITVSPARGQRTSVNVNHIVSMDLPEGVE